MGVPLNHPFHHFSRIFFINHPFYGDPHLWKPAFLGPLALGVRPPGVRKASENRCKAMALAVEVGRPPATREISNRKKMGIYIMMVNPIYHIEVAVYTWFC
jgi:hypothetical protein